MFDALLVSQSDGQSYNNVRIFEEQDLIEHNIPKIFEEWTCCMMADNQLIISHMWKMRVIQIDFPRKLAGPKSITVDKLVLDGNILYEDIKLLDADYWQSQDIPYYFRPWNNIAHQMVFTNKDGTFITHDTNVVGLIFNSSRQYINESIITNDVIPTTKLCTKHCSHVYYNKQSNKNKNITCKILK